MLDRRNKYNGYSNSGDDNALAERRSKEASEKDQEKKGDYKEYIRHRNNHTQIIEYVS